MNHLKIITNKFNPVFAVFTSKQAEN